MGDKSPKNIKKRALRVGQKAQLPKEPRAASTGGIPEAPVKPRR